MKTIQEDMDKRFEEGWTVKCVWCGFDHVHHTDVDVWTRREDGEGVEAVRVPAIHGAPGVGGQQPEDVCFPVGKNPSPRRSGVRIAMWCEGCWGHFALEVIQHKGSTYLRSARLAPGETSRTQSPWGAGRSVV